MSKRKTGRSVSPFRKGIYRFFRFITIVMLLGGALATGVVVGLFAAVSQVLPKGEELSDIRPAVPTRFFAYDGTLLARVYLPDQNREMLPITDMSPMVSPTVAIEDIRFYEHPGIDPRGIARAAVKNIVSGNTKEGASTITQQLARNLYLTRERKITRKLQEVVLALELERRYSKEEILETYLNQVYYGSNKYGLQSWGAQMAAKNYFGKDASDLSLAEAALLAGLPKNPRDYNPYKYPDAAKARRNLVLRSMLANDMINREDYEKAKEAPIKLAREKPLQEMSDWHAPYFVRHLLEVEMKRIFGQDADRLVYHYGVDVHTSLDPRMQKVAEETVTAQVKANRYRRIDDGALVAIDPKTGLIKALVGGTDFDKDQYNIVTQGRRQPGSAFKPFVYTAALLHGYTPETIVHDSRKSYPSGTGQTWSPKNSDGGYRGAMALKRALWASRNAAAASVAYDVGIGNIIDVAYRMGIKHPLERYLSTSLGASVVAPLEICSAYGTLANGGIHHPPTGVVRITTHEGSVLYEYRARPRKALPTDIADTMQEVMEGVIERGTALRARCPFPASGKTGTTNSYRDAWFIGYTDDLVAAVWVGNRQNLAMSRTYGGTIPAPIWREFMMVAQPIMAEEHEERKAELARINNLPEPTDIDRRPTDYIIRTDKRYAGLRNAPNELDEDRNGENQPAQDGEKYTVTVCAESGDLATAWCPETVVVTYEKGKQPTPPTVRCSMHTGPEDIPNAEVQSSNNSNSREDGVVLSICAETGKIATDKCPTVLRRRFTRNAPTETCPFHGD